jgi:hypothetical protein
MAKNDKAMWYRMDPAVWLLEAIDMPAKEWKTRSIRALKALILAEKGIDSLSDAMICDSEQILNQKRSAGRKGGNAKAENAKNANVSQESGPSETLAPPASRSSENVAEAKRCQVSASLTRALPTDRPTDRHTDRPTDNTDVQHRPEPTRSSQPPTPAGPEDGSGSASGRTVGSVVKIGDLVGSVGSGRPPASGPRKAQVFDMPRAYLAQFAASSLADGDEAKAVKGYAAQIRRVGEEAFREELSTLLSEIDAGEGMRSPGAVLMTRLKSIPNRRAE